MQAPHALAPTVLIGFESFVAVFAPEGDEHDTITTDLWRLCSGDLQSYQDETSFDHGSRGRHESTKGEVRWEE
jgi:hypothetical protein